MSDSDKLVAAILAHAATVNGLARIPDVVDRYRAILALLEGPGEGGSASAPSSDLQKTIESHLDDDDASRP